MTDTAASKFLSYVLRHRPDEIGLVLDAGGWADVDELLTRATVPLDRATLERIVSNSGKRRFALSSDGLRIRANQGHSFAVDLGLEPRRPPEVLYHGTAARNLGAIRAAGLDKRSRHHVHLSADPDTARSVGLRHGSPVVLRIDAAKMHADGAVFLCSVNGVWLTDHVPPRYIASDGSAPAPAHHPDRP